MNLDEINALLSRDMANERDFLHLTPNENIMSDAAKTYLTDNLAGRYHFGPAYLNEKFTLYEGFTSLAKTGVYKLLDKTSQQLAQRLGGSNVLFAPLSGLHSMMISLLTSTKVGQSVYSIDHAYGGHFATTGVIQGTGRIAKKIPMDPESLDIDYPALKELLASESGPYCIYLDVSYSLIPFDIEALRRMVGPTNRIVFDASHVIGLIMGGSYPNPLLQGADIITANTHKTLPGSHKGMIICKTPEIFSEVDGPGHAYYSSVHLDHTIALCISIQETLTYGDTYARAVIDNANILGDALTELGITCRRADADTWTYTHQLHMLTKDLGSVEQLAKAFYDNNIAVAFDDTFNQGPYIRIGLQEITRRGAGRPEILRLARLIRLAVDGQDVRSEVTSLKQTLNTVFYSFDAGLPSTVKQPALTTTLTQ